MLPPGQLIIAPYLLENRVQRLFVLARNLDELVGVVVGVGAARLKRQ